MHNENKGEIVSEIVRKYKTENKLYTYSDYVTWDDDIRYELIDGVPYAMASPTWWHQSVIGELFKQIDNYLQDKPCKVFLSPLDVRLNTDTLDNTVVQPDIIVVCDKSKLTKSGVTGAPDMVIEVLSPSSGKHDTLRKLRLYEKSGIREYWIVNPELKTVIVNTLKDGHYFVNAYGEDESAPIGIFDDCSIDLSKVFPEDEELIEN